MLQQSILCFNTSTIKCRAYRIVSTTLIQVGKAPYRIVSTTLIQVAHTHYRIVSQGFPIKSRAREHFSVLKPPRENILRQARVHPFYSGNSNRDLFHRIQKDKSAEPTRFSPNKLGANSASGRTLFFLFSYMFFLPWREKKSKLFLAVHLRSQGENTKFTAMVTKF